MESGSPLRFDISTFRRFCSFHPDLPQSKTPSSGPASQFCPCPSVAKEISYQRSAVRVRSLPSLSVALRVSLFVGPISVPISVHLCSSVASSSPRSLRPCGESSPARADCPARMCRARNHCDPLRILKKYPASRAVRPLSADRLTESTSPACADTAAAPSLEGAVVPCGHRRC